MFEVDRIVAIIKPKQKMLDFLREQPGANPDMTLRSLRRDCTALLIPSFTSPRKARDYMERIFPGVFENELEAWGVEPNNWPQNRTLQTFYKWFEIEFHSVVFDLAELEVS